MGLNRQQFNKYLNGQVHPTRHNMQRICDIFGVTESEILMDPQRFAQLVGLRRRPVDRAQLDLPMRHVERIFARSNPLDRYVGCYFRYFYSFGNKACIMRSLASIVVREERGYFKNVEVLRDPDAGRWLGSNKYEGMVFQLADRIQIVEYETQKVNSITAMTLYPSYRHRIDVLMGVQTGGPTRRGESPAPPASRWSFSGPRSTCAARWARRGCSTPQIRPCAPLIRAPTLDHSWPEFCRFAQGDGLVAPPDFVSAIGTLFPIAPCGRSSL